MEVKDDEQNNQFRRYEAGLSRIQAEEGLIAYLRSKDFFLFQKTFLNDPVKNTH